MILNKKISYENSSKTILGIISAILVYTVSGQESISECAFTIEEYNAALTDNTFVNYSDSRFIEFEVSELTQVDSLLYVASANEQLVQVLNIDTSALDYLSYTTKLDENSISVFVNESMEGLADYGGETDPNDELTLAFLLEFQNGATCTLRFIHFILDENTKVPQINFTSGEISIREDYPLNLIIPNAKVFAVDFDSEEPNNNFTTATDPLCPIEPSTPIHYTEEGKAELITFVLREQLDYDRGSDGHLFECIAIIEDFGEPPLSSSSEFIVNVFPYPDEAPQFTSVSYTGTIGTTLENTTVELLLPGPIKAIDMDCNCTDAVEYWMEDADLRVNGSEYFEMNRETGVITISQTIPPSFLVNDQVEFVLYSSDKLNLTGIAFLTLELPGLPQNETYIYFDNYMYASQVIDPEQYDVVLQVHAITSSLENVSYSLVDSPLFFNINEFTGEIWCRQNYTPPDDYYFGVAAQVEEIEDTSYVNINVVARIEGATPYLTESLTNVTISENYTGLITSLHAEGSCNFCLLAVDPGKYYENFELDSMTGEVFLVVSLVEDEVRNIKLFVSCMTDSCSASEYATDREGIDLHRNEAIIFIKVNDINDNSPSFGILRESVVAYPLNAALQRVDGVVLQAKAKDADCDDKLIYTMQDASDTFLIDSTNGNIFLKGDFACDSVEGCNISVTVYDSNQLHKDTTDIKILGLPITYISTIMLEDQDPSTIDEMLRETSNETGIRIRQIYSTMYESEEGKERLFDFDVLVHVYALQQDRLLDTAELNLALLPYGYNEARTFTEIEDYRGYTVIIEHFQTNDERETALEIAVAVLAGILGLLLIGIICIVIIWCIRPGLFSSYFVNTEKHPIEKHTSKEKEPTVHEAVFSQQGRKAEPNRFGTNSRWVETPAQLSLESTPQYVEVNATEIYQTENNEEIISHRDELLKDTHDIWESSSKSREDSETIISTSTSSSALKDVQEGELDQFRYNSNKLNNPSVVIPQSEDQSIEVSPTPDHEYYDEEKDFPSQGGEDFNYEVLDSNSEVVQSPASPYGGDFESSSLISDNSITSSLHLDGQKIATLSNASISGDSDIYENSSNVEQQRHVDFQVGVIEINYKEESQDVAEESVVGVATYL